MNLETVISFKNAAALWNLFCLRLYVEIPCIFLYAVILTHYEADFLWETSYS